MSIWGKVIGGVAGFALGGPIGGLLGAVAGHAMDRARVGQRLTGPASQQARQSAVAVAVIVLGAKMAKADGRVTRDEIEAFKTVFQIPAGDMRDVGRLFNEARREAEGFEPYAEQLGAMFAHEPQVLEGVLGGLMHVALADGVVHPNEIEFLEKVSASFGFSAYDFERIRATHMGPGEADPYEILGIPRDANEAEIKAAYRKLIRENHPDTLIAQGLPQEFIDVANEKMAAINAAYEKVEKLRSLP